MSTSSPEVISSAFEAAPSAHPAKVLAGRASVGIREGLSHAREQFTDTVETVAHKAGVPLGVKDKLSATENTVQDKVEQVTRNLHEGKEAVQDKVDEVTRQAESLTNQAWEQVPAPVAGRITHLAQAVRQRPVPAAAMVFTVFALLLLRRFLRRTK
jgi:gas vesicle protein